MVPSVMLRFLARLVAVLCAIAFVFLTIAAVFAFAIGTRFMQARTYANALIRDHFYAKVPGIVADLAVHGAKAEQAASRGAENDALAMVAQLTPADWNSLFGAFAPPEYLQQQTESALEQYLGYLHSDEPVPEIQISLVELRKNLVGPRAEEAYLAMLATKPPCTPEQLLGSGGLPVGCQPPADQLPRVREAFRAAMRQAADQMPAQVNLLAPAAMPGRHTALEVPIKTRHVLVGIEYWAGWSPAVPGALLLLIALFGVRSLRGLLLWWGIPCLLAGIATALLALPLVPLARWLFSTLVVPSLPAQVPGVAVDALFGVITAPLQEMMIIVLKTGGGLAAGGLVCMIAARFCPRPAPPAADAFRSAS
jgi:hypothetical protein